MQERMRTSNDDDDNEIAGQITLRDIINVIPTQEGRISTIAKFDEKVILNTLHYILKEATLHYATLFVDHFYIKPITRTSSSYLIHILSDCIKSIKHNLNKDNYDCFLSIMQNTISAKLFDYINVQAIDAKPHRFKNLLNTLSCLIALANIFYLLNEAQSRRLFSKMTAGYALVGLDVNNEFQLIQFLVSQLPTGKYAPLFFLEMVTWLQGLHKRCFDLLPPQFKQGNTLLEAGLTARTTTEDTLLFQYCRTTKMGFANYCNQLSHAVFFRINTTLRETTTLKQQAVCLSPDVQAWLLLIPSFVSQRSIPIDLLLLITTFLTSLSHKESRSLFDSQKPRSPLVQPKLTP